MDDQRTATGRQAARASRPAWRRWTELVAGAILMIVAPIVGGPLAPGPLGFLGFALGLALVLRNSRWAKKRYVRFKRRWPHWGGWTDWGLRRGPRPALTKSAQNDRQKRKSGEAEDRQQHRRIGENAA
jgi:hypothetical protein